MQPGPARQNLYEIVRDRAARWPTAVALGSQQGLAWQSIDSRQLLAAVDRVASDLAGRGVSAGDRVVVWAPSQWRTPVFLFACWKLGAVVVPFDKEMNAEAATRILDLTEPRLVIAGYDERPDWTKGHALTPWWEPDTGPVASEPWTPSAESLAAVVFTSGTTGQPKGCMISHANLLSQVDAFPEAIPLDPTCRLASILPLSHLFELTTGLLYPLERGAAIHYIPSRRAPDILRVFSEQRVTHMIAVPQLLTLMGNGLNEQLRKQVPAPVYRLLNGAAERLPMEARRRLFAPVHRKLGGHLRLLAAGGAALPESTQRLWERLGVRVVQGYGTSECSPVVATSAPDGSTPIGTVGRPIRGVEVRLASDGELFVTGPNVMQGYFREPRKTAEVLKDGWYATGDLAEIDAAGNIRLVGRAKDLIVLPSGMNVWPQDVEDALREERGVRDAAVMAVPTPQGGAVLHAWLIPDSATAARSDAATILARANSRLARHQRLATAAWFPEPDFPRTSTLKVRRHLLPSPEGVASRPATLVAGADDLVARAVADTAHLPGVAANQTLAEVGIDSLSMVELALALEDATGKRVREDDLHADMTVDDLRAFVADAPPAEEDLGPESVGQDGPRVPTWPYGPVGRAVRGVLASPFDLLYYLAIPETIVVGGEHLAGLPKAAVFAGTHRSFADLPLVRFGLARTPARRFSNRLVVAAMAEGEGWKSPWARYAIVAFGVYPLERQRGREQSLRGLVSLAERGNGILIFPQGTHTHPEDEQGPEPAVRFKSGVAHIARALGVPVVPFGIAGSEEAMPSDVTRFKGLVIAGVPVSITRTPLAIAFGPPLRQADDESATAFTTRLQDASYALARQAQERLAAARAARARRR